jgi:RNase P subunit RPR2
MDPTTARLRYLNDAAHVLTLSSPSLAAAFQARYDHVADENEVNPPDSRAREICSACGHNMLSTAMYTASSRNKSGTIQHKRMRKNETKGNTPTKDKTVVLECRACLAKTEIKLPAAKRSRSSSGRIAQTETASSSPINAIPTPSRAASTQGPPTQNSRARAKRAKSRNSLHAMLAQSKEQAQSDKGFGFGLMDLMKST